MEKREIKTPSVTEQVKAKEKTGKKGGASTQQPRPLDRAAKKEIQAKFVVPLLSYLPYQYLVTKRNRSLYKAHAVYMRVPWYTYFVAA